MGPRVSVLTFIAVLLLAIQPVALGAQGAEPIQDQPALVESAQGFIAQAPNDESNRTRSLLIATVISTVSVLAGGLFLQWRSKSTGQRQTIPAPEDPSPSQSPNEAPMDQDMEEDIDALIDRIFKAED